MEISLQEREREGMPFLLQRGVLSEAATDYSHWHEAPEILAFTEGEGTVLCNEVRYPVAAGELFIVNAEALHEVICERGRLCYDSLIADTAFCHAFGLPIETLNFQKTVRSPALFSLFSDLLAADRTEGEFREARVISAGMRLLVSLLDYTEAKQPASEAERDNLPQIKRAIGYIKENLQKKMGIEEIAEAAGLSRSYFSRRFRALTHLTVVEYINRVRCLHACRLIRSGEYRIQAAALASGFENMSYFTRTYRRHLGILPSEENRPRRAGDGRMQRINEIRGCGDWE